MVYGYIRVSTDKQDTENQKLGISEKAARLELVIDKWISDDGVSGTKEPDERLLGKLLKQIKQNDVLIASEISRLGRNLFMVMRILEHCMKSGTKVYTVKDGYELGDNIQSKVLAFAFGLAAEIERDMISKRTKEALARKKKEGAVLGRPVGRKSKSKLTDKEKKITEYLKADLSYAAIGRLLKCHRLTVASFAKENNIEPDIVKKRSVAPQSTLIKIRNAQSEKRISKSREEFIELYKECHFNLSTLAVNLKVSNSLLQGYMKKNNLKDDIIRVEQEQRMKVKSKNQIERETLGYST